MPAEADKTVDTTTATAAPAKDAASTKEPAASQAAAADPGKTPAAGGDAADKTEAAAVDDEKATTGSVLDEETDGEDEDDGADEGESEGAEPAKADVKSDKAKAAGDFPDDWREKFVAAQNLGDKKAKDGKPIAEKLLGQLKRYKSLPDALNALIATQNKIRSGEYKTVLAEDATDAEKAAWREANGIPKEAKDYDIAKVDGHKWTDADKPVTEAFKAVAHAANLDQAQLNHVTTWYAKSVQAAQAAAEEAIESTDKADVETTTDGLRTELGGDYRPAMALMKRLVKDTAVFPGELGEKLAEARDAEGHRLINDPAFARLLIDMARERYGEAAMVSGQEARQTASREEELVKLMQTDIGAYNNIKNARGETGADELLRIRREKAARSGGRRAA